MLVDYTCIINITWYIQEYINGHYSFSILQLPRAPDLTFLIKIHMLNLIASFQFLYFDMNHFVCVWWNIEYIQQLGVWFGQTCLCVNKSHFRKLLKIISFSVGDAILRVCKTEYEICCNIENYVKTLFNAIFKIHFKKLNKFGIYLKKLRWGHWCFMSSQDSSIYNDLLKVTGLDGHFGIIYLITNARTKLDILLRCGNDKKRRTNIYFIKSTKGNTWNY